MEQTSAATSDDAQSISPRRVRTNWLLYSWSQISGASKVILLIRFMLSTIQIIVTITMLALGSSRELYCEKPFQLYLVVFVVRVGISLPLTVYHQLFSPRTRRRRRRRRGTEVHNDTIDTVQPSSSSSTSSSRSSPLPSSTNEHDNNTTLEQQQTHYELHQTAHGSSNLISGWTYRVKSLLDLFSILWFIVGNYLLFSASDCSTSAGLYYYTVLAWVVLGYLILFIPLLACASVIFCLPCVLVALRMFNINVSNVMVGGTKEEIEKIPVFRYKAPESSTDNGNNNNNSADMAAAAPSTTTENNTASKKMSFMRRLMRKQSYSSPSSLKNLDTMTIARAEDAICSICLGEYETDELVCKLWCEHHYHKDCVHEWLGLNSKCPLCKRDFRGKGHAENDNQEEREEELY